MSCLHVIGVDNTKEFLYACEKRTYLSLEICCNTARIVKIFQSIWSNKRKANIQVHYSICNKIWRRFVSTCEISL